MQPKILISTRIRRKIDENRGNLKIKTWWTPFFSKLPRQVPIGFSKFSLKNVSNVHFGSSSINWTDFDQSEFFESGRQLSKYILFDFKFSDVENLTISLTENSPTKTLWFSTIRPFLTNQWTVFRLENRPEFSWFR